MMLNLSKLSILSWHLGLLAFFIRPAVVKAQSATIVRFEPNIRDCIYIKPLISPFCFEKKKKRLRSFVADFLLRRRRGASTTIYV